MKRNIFKKGEVYKRLLFTLLDANIPLRKGPGLQFGLNRGHRGARREPKLFCKFIFSSW